MSQFPWAQAIVIALNIMALASRCPLHGKEKTEKINMHAYAIGIVLSFLLLGWGGFWSPLAHYLWR